MLKDIGHISNKALQQKAVDTLKFNSNFVPLQFYLDTAPCEKWLSYSQHRSNIKNIYPLSNRKKLLLKEADFSRLDLSGLSLSYIDFSGADLSHTVFHNCCLKFANFTSSILYETDFTNAEVEGSDFPKGIFLLGLTHFNFTDKLSLTA